MAVPRRGRGHGLATVSAVDPGSDEARRRREALARTGAAEGAARGAVAPYAMAALLAGIAVPALAAVRPDLARSYSWLVAGLAALPFLHTMFVGAATGGWIVPRPFGLRPVATVLVATALFAGAVVLAPARAVELGPALAGFVVGVAVAGAFLRWITAPLLD